MPLIRQFPAWTFLRWARMFASVVVRSWKITSQLCLKRSPQMEAIYPHTGGVLRWTLSASLVSASRAASNHGTRAESNANPH